MARRIRRPRVVWLPSSNVQRIDSATDDISSIQQATFQAPSDAIGEKNAGLMAVVNDIEPLPNAANTTLADINSSGYRLRRIVGKVYVSAAQAIVDDGGVWLVTAGFIVLRVGPSGVPLAPVAGLHPAIVDNDESPWIWRRSWILSNLLTTSVQTTNQGWGPITFTGAGRTGGRDMANNSLNGGVSDGPHVDQKTARIVSRDLRLFLAIGTTCLNVNSSQLTGLIDVITDLRVLGTMITTSGNRRNATR